MCFRLLLVVCSIALIALFGIAPAERASAADCSVVYVGPQAGFWSDSDNWRPRQVPGAGDNVCISATAVHLDKEAEIGSLTMDGAGTLEMRAPLSLSGPKESRIAGRGVSIVRDNPVTPTRLTVHGKLVLANSRIHVFAGAFLTNFGTIEAKGETSLTATGNGAFENEGTFEVNGRTELNLPIRQRQNDPGEALEQAHGQGRYRWVERRRHRRTDPCRGAHATHA